MSSLSGKAALVTGASGGIGRAIALRLAGAGATVAVHYSSSRARAEETLAQVQAQGGKGFVVGADLTTMAGIDALFAGLDAGGMDRLDVLVNNAGVGKMGTLAETDEALFDRQMALNVKAPFFVSKKALERFNDGGAIVNISSMVSIAAYPGCIAYALGKAALNSFTTSLAADLGPRRIRVNAITPGATMTDFINDLVASPQFVEAITGMTALGRIADPDDIARVALFLASHDGSWITGQVLQASGGMHL